MGETDDFTADDIARIVSRKLSETFDAIAKDAMQAAAIARDPSVNWFEKLNDAHSRVTLIVEVAMRGLGEAHRLSFASAVIIASQEN
jgi:hypothetical protein